jgi:hypothetical protein
MKNKIIDRSVSNLPKQQKHCRGKNKSTFVIVLSNTKKEIKKIILL